MTPEEYRNSESKVEMQQDSDIEVITTNGRYYHLLQGWQIDASGNITGKGAASDANALHSGDEPWTSPLGRRESGYPSAKILSLTMGRFEGTIEADSISVVRATVPDPPSTFEIVLGVLSLPALILMIAWIVDPPDFDYR